MIKTFNSLLVTMFGLGKIKIIPGTFGSLATTIFLYFVFHIIKLSPNIVLIGLLIIFIYSFIAVASHIKDRENKDPKVPGIILIFPMPNIVTNNELKLLIIFCN